MAASLGLGVLFAWPSRKNLVPALGDLVLRPAFGWISAAFLLLAFAQVLDEESIWLLLLGEGYPYAARRMGEESVELAAYALLVVGLFEYVLTLRARSRSTA